MGRKPFENVPALRRRIMSSIRPANTKPELAVRSLLHRAGYRFRVNVHQLPGRPDILFPSRRVAVFVHGCFWHAHEACGGAAPVKTRRKFWAEKFAANRARDALNIARLQELGWRTFVIWECQDPTEWIGQLTNLLGPAHKPTRRRTGVRSQRHRRHV